MSSCNSKWTGETWTATQRPLDSLEVDLFLSCERRWPFWAIRVAVVVLSCPLQDSSRRTGCVKLLGKCTMSFKPFGPTERNFHSQVNQVFFVFEACTHRARSSPTRAMLLSSTYARNKAYICSFNSQCGLSAFMLPLREMSFIGRQLLCSAPLSQSQSLSFFS